MGAVVVGVFGKKLDKAARQRWRPTVSLAYAPKQLGIEEVVLVHEACDGEAARAVARDLREAQSGLVVRLVRATYDDHYDYGTVFGFFDELLRSEPRDGNGRPARDYYFHVTTGSPVVHAVLHDLVNLNVFPARLLVTVEPAGDPGNTVGGFRLLADPSELQEVRRAAQRTVLSGADHLRRHVGIADEDASELFRLLADLRPGSNVAMPVLILGETGTGKTRLARAAAQHIASKRQGAPFIAANCATFVGDVARSELFGHERGAFSGAVSKRTGFLEAAHGGVLFLDEIGTLTPEIQAMLLKAIEEQEFFRVGSSAPTRTNFQLIAATNDDIPARVLASTFREDLFARINCWQVRLRPLRERRAQIQHFIEPELETLQRDTGRRSAFTRGALRAYLKFATSSEALWLHNFRDLQVSIRRLHTRSHMSMQTAAGRPLGEIGEALVEDERQQLLSAWAAMRDSRTALAPRLLPRETLDAMDAFDRVQLEHVLEVCTQSRSLAEAGRRLFNVTRIRHNGALVNDSDRLSKYLRRCGTDWASVRRLA